MKKKPKILYYSVLDFQQATMDYMNQHFDVVVLPDPNCDSEEMLVTTEAIFAPMGFPCDKKKIDMCPKLRVIGTPTTGELHIDVEYANEKKIIICSLKNQKELLYNITSTAELTWGLVLAITRKIPWAFESVCKGQWSGKEFGRQTPRMLSAMTLGIVGLGRLGSWVAKYGESFKMKVLYYDPYITDDRFMKCDNLIDLARQSDIVSIHVHLSNETRNLIGDDFISSMPGGGYIINTARGGVLNEESLMDALQDGHLAGAALDMIEGEHLYGFKDSLSEHPLIRYANTHDNLLITPKIGGATRDAWEITEKKIIKLIMQSLEMETGEDEDN
ncbi:MAG: hydroxyacid dehydrogenase [Nitrospirae bacterium]|nr:hydroxyacid dehydrogenase [Nitrospirota bacterium]